MHILDYLEKLPDTPQAELMKYLHHFISSYEGITAKVSFSTPFYTGQKWMMYSSKQKDGSIELCFICARWFSQHLEYLDFKKRKQVAGITYSTVTDIDEDVLDKLIKEAIDTEHRLKSAKKKK